MALVKGPTRRQMSVPRNTSSHFERRPTGRSCGVSVERLDLLSREAHGDHLRRLGPPPGTSPTAALQLPDVIPGPRFVSPLLDLLISSLVFNCHDKIV